MQRIQRSVIEEEGAEYEIGRLLDLRAVKSFSWRVPTGPVTGSGVKIRESLGVQMAHRALRLVQISDLCTRCSKNEFECKRQDRRY